MKIKAFFLSLLCILLLVGCDSEEEVDQKVQDYINETYGFEVDFIYRESINEGNMGDRIYQVQRKDEPKVEFTVDLSGMWETEVIADNYEIQEKAYYTGKKFIETYKNEINQLKFSEIEFIKYNDYKVRVKYNGSISKADDASLQPIMEFITLLNEFRKSEKIDDETTDLVIYYLNDESLYLGDIDEIQTIEHMKLQIYTD